MNRNILNAGSIVYLEGNTMSPFAIFLGIFEHEPSARLGITMYSYAYIYDSIPSNKNKEHFWYIERLNLYANYIDTMAEGRAPKEVMDCLTNEEIVTLYTMKNLYWSNINQNHLRLMEKHKQKLDLFIKIDNRIQGKIQEIKDIWHRQWCFCFIDERYVEQDECQSRLIISYEINTTKPRTGFLAVPEQDTDFVFILHNVYIEENLSINLVDRSINSFPAPDVKDLEELRIAAQNCLAKINDEHYLMLVSKSEPKDKLLIAEKTTMFDYTITENYWG